MGYDTHSNTARAHVVMRLSWLLLFGEMPVGVRMTASKVPAPIFAPRLSRMVSFVW